MKVQNGGSGWAYFGMLKYQKTGEMDREYLFLFFSNTDFRMEYQMMRQTIFEKRKKQTPKMTFVFVLRYRSVSFLNTKQLSE